MLAEEGTQTETGWRALTSAGEGIQLDLVDFMNGDAFDGKTGPVTSLGEQSVLSGLTQVERQSALIGQRVVLGQESCSWSHLNTT